MEKKNIIKEYGLSKNQIILIDKYLNKLKKTNKSLNLVGSSTLENSWDRHINDSLQLTKFIKNKNSSIIDFGTGAGLPGLILSICGYKNVLLTDSKYKKIKFIRSFSKENNVLSKTLCSRVENIKKQKFDFVICRAFAPLFLILNYSLIFSKRNTSLLFLKGRNVKKEIQEANKQFSFEYELFESKSDGGGFIIKVNKLKKL